MIYVMSDIHGHQEAFDDILSQIQLSDHDHLYILGDVIDRGPDGIELFQRIRQMPQTTLLLGNHEYMMINRYQAPEDIDAKVLWYMNGGGETEDHFRTLKTEEQISLLKYLKALPLQLEVTVNDKTFILVHAAPRELYGQYRWEREDETKFVVWHRWKAEALMVPGKTVVIGHTSTRHYQSTTGGMKIFYGKNFIDIDCGCCQAFRHGRLACLRLDDMHEYYAAEIQS